MFIKIHRLNKVGCVLAIVIWSQFRTLFRRNIWMTTKTLLIFSGSHWILKSLLSGLQLVNSHVCYRPHSWFFVLILDSKSLTRLKKILISNTVWAPVILPKWSPFDSRQSFKIGDFHSTVLYLFETRWTLCLKFIMWLLRNAKTDNLW